MYTTIIHPLRKAYNLSINEYCVLEAIRNLANNTKYKGWCVMSQKRIGDGLDLSRDTVIRAYKKLEEVELIEKRRDTRRDTAVRANDEWNEWFMADKADLLLSLKTGTAELSTMQLRGGTSVGISTSSSKLQQGLLQNATSGCSKLQHNTNKETNSKNIYGEFVFLSDLEMEKLKARLGNRREEYIERLNDYIGSKGVKYKSHYHTILNWHRNDTPKTAQSFPKKTIIY